MDRENLNIVYLKRLRVVQTPWFAFYIHWIYLPDNDKDCHDHPWAFYSYILKGGYTEEVYTDIQNLTQVEERTWGRGSLHVMPTEYAHQIKTLQDKTITLVFTGRRKRTWGFWTESGFVPWHDYVREGETYGPNPFMGNET